MITTGALKQQIIENKYENLFRDVYIDESVLDYQKERYIKAVEKYEALYGEAMVTVYSAPGRSEIGGNHTDHQHGEILAASINQDAIAVVTPAEDGIVKVVSDEMAPIEININNIDLVEAEKESTIALIKGVLKGCVDRGYRIGGFRAYITSDVLIGAGLSSSAAFEALIGTIVSHEYNDNGIDAVTIAIIGQYAENVYFGKPCGLMDQMACSVGNLVHVDFAEPKEPVVERVAFDMNKHGYSLCITNTKGSHADLTAEYAAMPIEMKQVAACFGKEVLLGLTNEDIMKNIVSLREKCGDRAVLRAIHFINENARVDKEVKALKEDRIDDFMALVKASGDSSYKYLQNVYTTQDITSQNLSIALAVSEVVLSDGSGVSRVHGGGLAGTIQALVKNEKVQEYIEAMDGIFGEKSCNVLKIRQYGGMKVIG